MRLVRAAKGAARVPAVEVLVSTGLIRDYIVNEEKTYLIREAIAAGTSQYGVQTFDQSLFQLFQSGLISIEEALHNASNADEFRMRCAGILSSEQAISSSLGQTRGLSPSVKRETDDMFVKH